MLTTKIRTTIVGLAATFGVAAAVVGPMAPAASAEYVRYHYEYCHHMKQEFEAEIEKYAKSGGTDIEAFNEAVEDLQLAENNECGWATQAQSSIKSLTPPTSAGTLLGSSTESSTVSPVSPLRTVTSTSTASQL